MAQGQLIHLVINPGLQTSAKLFIINTNTNSVSSKEIKISLTGSDLQMQKKKKKKAYKRVNIRLKRNFLRTEGNMLSMKTDNHKLFYKMFKRRKGASNCPLNVNDLKNFFQDLMKSGTYNQEIPGDRECKGILCAKMDNSIQAEEVKNAMKRLKKEKATGLDGILNEVYISCESLLVPVIVKIFNKILNSEKFPSS